MDVGKMRSTPRAPNHDRRCLYEERGTILHGLVAAMRSPVDSFRRAALRTIVTMSDISDDEILHHTMQSMLQLPLVMPSVLWMSSEQGMEVPAPAVEFSLQTLAWWRMLWDAPMLGHLSRQLR